MSMLTTNCPHCSAIEIALKVRGVDHTRNDRIVNVFTTCPRCSKPSCHELWPGPGARTTQDWFGTGAAKEQAIEILATSGWKIRQTYPAPMENAAPEATPPEIERIYLQAMSTHRRSEFDAAAMLYRKTLETAVKALNPEGKGSLDARIMQLGGNNLIPESVATWAHEIRGIGNDAAHDVSEPSKHEVDAASEFVEAFLTYAFTMPDKIRNRMTKPAEPLTAEESHH